VWGRRELCVGVWWGNVKERAHGKEASVGMIILNYILKK
jgi:hypothetical protein